MLLCLFCLCLCAKSFLCQSLFCFFALISRGHFVCVLHFFCCQLIDYCVAITGGIDASASSVFIFALYLFFFLLSSSFNFLSCVLQTRTPRVTRLSPTQPALADQASRVSFASAENLETMSEPDIPIGFNRMNRLRQSLPLARTSSQAKLRAPGQTSVFKKTPTLCVLHCTQQIQELA